MKLTCLQIRKAGAERFHPSGLAATTTFQLECRSSAIDKISYSLQRRDDNNSGKLAAGTCTSCHTYAQGTSFSNFLAILVLSSYCVTFAHFFDRFVKQPCYTLSSSKMQRLARPQVDLKQTLVDASTPIGPSKRRRYVAKPKCFSCQP